jgi:hypothetical protein
VTSDGYVNETEDRSRTTPGQDVEDAKRQAVRLFFADGNERTAAVAALYFLEIKGMNIEPGQNEYECLLRRAAAGEATERDVASFSRGCRGS